MTPVSKSLSSNALPEPQVGIEPTTAWFSDAPPHARTPAVACSYTPPEAWRRVRLSAKTYAEVSAKCPRVIVDLLVTAGVSPWDAVRFARLVRIDGACWMWLGSDNGRYPVFFTAGRQGYAHRFMAAAIYGPIPAGFDVCHHCDTPRCVRPDHLFLGTPRDNTHDMIAKGRARMGEWQRAVTHCPFGHRLMVRPKGDRRYCPECNRLRMERSRRARGVPIRGPYRTARSLAMEVAC